MITMVIASSSPLDLSTLPDVTAQRAQTFTSIELSGLSSEDADAVRTWAADRGYTIDGLAPRLAAFLFPADTDRPLAAIDFKRGLRIRLQPVGVKRDGVVVRTLYFAPDDVREAGDGFALANDAAPVLMEEPHQITWYATDGSVYAVKPYAKSTTPSVDVAKHPAIRLADGESL